MSVSEDAKPGQPSTSANDDHVERVHTVIHGNSHLTVREVADKVGISIGSCHQTFTEKDIITGDETWVYGCDVETKMQSSQ
jgi:ubiquitin C-terminal hydrolase